VLNAIRYHTTGREDMSMLEKIICISDYVEPKRTFEGVTEIRELALVDIDKALFAAFSTTIAYIISKNYILHPMTVIARNRLLLNML
jgi:predicted HD superfamily hydrolase involved in NAD metabolism